MVVFLLFWSTCWVQIAVAGHSPGAGERVLAGLVEREWTNASGTKRARAVLLGIEGDKLRLRRTDGKISTATLTHLSEPDRQYVANVRERLAAKSQPSPPSPSIAAPVVKKVIEGVQTLREAPQWLSPSQANKQTRIVPAAVVYVRVSRNFLEDYVERTVHRRKPVHDYILGTRVVGESVTRGKTRLELIPNFGQLLGKIAFDGTVHATTRGYNGPVVLHQNSKSTFRSSKLIGLDENGLSVGSAVTHAPTTLCTNCIATSLPRLRGRIARRIASRRVASSHDLAESITADHTAASVGADFDKRINESVAKVQQVFKSKIPELDAAGDPLRADMRFRSNTDSVEIAMVRQAATADERKLRPPIVDGNPDVAVRVHRTLLARAITDPQLRESLAPLFGKLLKARMEQGKSAVLGKEAPVDPTRWSLDLDWLTMDFTDMRM